MIDKFHNLDPEKQQRIINAAMREFACKGFKQAKTDTIVKEAGISKGLLFHYFGTKKNLFLYLYNYLLDFVEREFSPLVSTDPDIIERLRQNSLMKIELYRQHPHLIDFMASVAAKGCEEVQQEVAERMAAFQRRAYALGYSGIDKTLFRDGIDPDRAIEIIIWTVEGFGNKIMAQFRDQAVQDLDFARYTREFDQYLALLRDAFYKGGDGSS